MAGIGALLSAVRSGLTGQSVADLAGPVDLVVVGLLGSRALVRLAWRRALPRTQQCPLTDCPFLARAKDRTPTYRDPGSRFDQNVTGFRAEEEFGFNATPYVATGKFVKILGLEHA